MFITASQPDWIYCGGKFLSSRIICPDYAAHIGDVHLLWNDPPPLVFTLGGRLLAPAILQSVLCFILGDNRKQ